MNASLFAEILGADFYTGVPDSQLRGLCDELMSTYGTDPSHHIIAANEGNAAALAAGYHLATGKVPVVYLQNSGEGNIVNPLCSLLHEKVYAIPSIFVVGWRGEPGIHDEPQHIYQGEITLKLLEDLEIPAFVIRPETSEAQVRQAMEDYRPLLAQGRPVAFVIAKGALTCEKKVRYQNENSMTREQIIEKITEFSGDDPIISTTGKASRELFEIRERRGQDHRRDFLTVGSMGHSSSIALGIALQKPQRRIFCLDGDGAVLMHMGAMAVIGSVHPRNFVHIVINNGAHETVGGMPTAAGSISLCQIALGCGYAQATLVRTEAELEQALLEARKEVPGPILIEVECAIGARADLGRPTTTPQENKLAFMAHLQA